MEVTLSFVFGVTEWAFGGEGGVALVPVDWEPVVDCSYDDPLVGGVKLS